MTTNYGTCMEVTNSALQMIREMMNDKGLILNPSDEDTIWDSLCESLYQCEVQEVK